MKRSLNILLADDEEIVHATICDYLTDSGHKTESAYDGAAALELIKHGAYDLALVDVRMPKMDGMTLLGKIRKIQPELPVVIITGHGNMDITIQALREGAEDFLTKPIKFFELEAVLVKSLFISKLRQERTRLKEAIGGIQLSSYSDNSRFIGVSEATGEIHEHIQRAVSANCDTILITGETGAGKEVVARAIHFNGGSPKSPFIAVNCPAIPEELIESELFGHVKGAFTGAVETKIGYFEMADNGTLFLYEIGDLSASAQAKLLRALETRTIRRVGGKNEIQVNTRVIAATNVWLQERVEKKKFRSDLYYRLHIYPIHILPLRERRDDILPLAEHFLDSYAGARGLDFEGFSSNARDRLINYDYPGNARELRNIIERAAMTCRSSLIKSAHLNLPALQQPHTFSGLLTNNTECAGLSDREDLATELKLSPATQEHDRIINALHEAKWNRKKAAKLLNIPYSTLRYKMKNFSIE